MDLPTAEAQRGSTARVIQGKASSYPRPRLDMAEVSGLLGQLLLDAAPLDRPRLLLEVLTLPLLDLEERQAVILNILRSADLARHKTQILDKIIAATGVVQALPEPYQKLVHDSSLLLFSSLPDDRIADKISAQLALPPGAPVGQRVVLLIEDMPTLQKLGQTVARSPLIGIEFREFLIGLESGMKTDKAAFDRVLEEELGSKLRELDIHVDEKPLAAASIAQVSRFEWPQPKGPPIAGVFKIQKPGVREHLADEIAAFRVVVEHFENHRSEYPLEEFDLRQLLQNLTDALDRDVNTAVEHENLDLAAKSLAHHQGVHIPRRFPELCTDHVLAMEFIQGGKIVKAFPDQPDKRSKLASKLFKYTVWHALFHDGWFHADPHAGNVFYEPGVDGQQGRIAFLDWSLAARLSREEREAMVKLIVSIERGKVLRVLEALQALSHNDLHKDIDGKALEVDIRWILADYLSRPKLAPPGDRPAGAGMRPQDLGHPLKPASQSECVPPVTALDYVLDRALARGLAFKQEILLFKKAMLTLDSVACDLDPKMTRQRYLTKKLTGQMLIEFPKRIVGLPWPNSRNYKSLVSNNEFFGLIGTKIANIFR